MQNLLQTIQFWTQTSMHTQYLLIDYRRYWHCIKYICKDFPKLQIVLSFTLIIETVYPIDTGGLMITPQ